jgi:transketolase
VGKGIVLKKGAKLALIGTGGTVAEALQASEKLADRNPWVIDIHTVKPIDKDLLKTLAHECTHIVTVEDHNIIGGLGSAVAEVLSETGFQGKLLRLGVQDTYGESGLPDELFEKYGFQTVVSIDYDSYRYGVMAPFKSIHETDAIKRMVLEL